MRGVPESIESITLAVDTRRVRHLGLWILLAAILPVSLGISGGLYLTRLIPEVETAEQLGLLAPLLLGISLVLISVLARTRLALGVATLTTLLIMGTLFWSSDIASGDLYGGLLSFVGRQPVPVMVGLVLVSAGASLRLQEPEAPIGDFLLKSGACVLLVLYVLPQRGQPFAIHLVETMYTVSVHGDSRQLLGYGVFWLLDLMPLIIAIRALVAAHRKTSTDSLLGPLARYGLSGVVVLMCYRLMVTGFGLDAVLYQLRSALILGVTIGVGSFALELIVRHMALDLLPIVPDWSRKSRDIRLRQLLRTYLSKHGSTSDEGLLEMNEYKHFHPLLRWTIKRRLQEVSDMEHFQPVAPFSPDSGEAQRYLARLEGRPALPGSMTSKRVIRQYDDRGTLGTRLLSTPWRFSVIAGAFFIIGASLMIWKSQPYRPNLDWTLGAPTTAQNEIFTKHFPRYVTALSRYSYIQAKGTESKDHKDRVERQVEILLGAAYAIDRDFGEDVRSFVRISEDPDFSGRVWLRAIRRINERVRALDMPYYIQANYVEMSPNARIRRIFYVLTYQVERLRRFNVDGEEYAAIHLRKLGGLNLGGRWLGLVRGDMPFALVMLDEVEDHADNVLNAISHEGGCGSSESSYHPLAERADTACASFINEILTQRGFDVHEDREVLRDLFIDIQIRSTERHELQHLVDGKGPDIPLELFELAPRASDAQLSMAAKELSAQLAEFNTEDPLALALALAQAQSFLLAEEEGGGVYRLGAGLILEYLTKQDVIKTFGAVDLQPVVDAWTILRQKTMARLSWAKSRVQDAHDSLSGEKCAGLTLVEEHRPGDGNARLVGSPDPKQK
jgi:hypothetical protein